MPIIVPAPPPPDPNVALPLFAAWAGVDLAPRNPHTYVGPFKGPTACEICGAPGQICTSDTHQETQHG